MHPHALTVNGFRLRRRTSAKGRLLPTHRRSWKTHGNRAAATAKVLGSSAAPTAAAAPAPRAALAGGSLS